MPEDIQEDEYELLPHREIEELKEELSKLKEFEIAPSKKLHVSLMELNHKLDKLITIFEDASHEMRVEEGGLSFSDKMRPLLEKMNKVLEQNGEIASGILALADMVRDMKGETTGRPRMPEPRMPGEIPSTSEGVPKPPQMEGAAPQGMPPPPVPPAQEGTEGVPPPPEKSAPGVPPGEPLPPLPKRRTFGL